MNAAVARAAARPAPALFAKADPDAPALLVAGPSAAMLRAGTSFAGVTLAEDTAVPVPDAGFVPGMDYGIVLLDEGLVSVVQLAGLPNADVLGGFHFAPGGIAPGRAGGSLVPAINPLSVWDLERRPTCADPRGMALVDLVGGRSVWVDIYLLNADHADGGTSRFGVQIANGNRPPQRPPSEGEPAGRYRGLDYDTAVAVMAHHGKRLLTIEEYFVAAYGVTERTSAAGNPGRTGLDAPRTSAGGLMQAAGNFWIWGTDGDPDTPRASVFGGSWGTGSVAGSRRALVDNWPGDSNENLSARGCCDPLQPA